MTTYDMCEYIRKKILSVASGIYAYDNLPYNSARLTIKELPENILNTGGIKKIDPCDLTEKQMRSLGFQIWDRSDPMRLIPLWLLPFLIDEFKAQSVNDDSPKLFKREDINSDHLFGVLAYGVIPK